MQMEVQISSDRATLNITETPAREWALFLALPLVVLVLAFLVG